MEKKNTEHVDVLSQLFDSSHIACDPHDPCNGSRHTRRYKQKAIKALAEIKKLHLDSEFFWERIVSLQRKSPTLCNGLLRSDKIVKLLDRFLGNLAT